MDKTELQRNTRNFISSLFFTWTAESIANSSLFSSPMAYFFWTRKAQSVSEQWIIDEYIYFSKLNLEKEIKIASFHVILSYLCWTPASQEAEQLDQADQAPQPREEEIRAWNCEFPFLCSICSTLSQFIGAILASSGMCQVQFDLYGCRGRRLIWNN